MDIAEYLSNLALLAPARRNDLVVTYYSACSLQHGQKITQLPKDLLSKNGFRGQRYFNKLSMLRSAGTYSILQPNIPAKLRDRRVANIASVEPEMIAAGNIGCVIQITASTSVPVAHTIELLDWRRVVRSQE